MLFSMQFFFHFVIYLFVICTTPHELYVPIFCYDYYFWPEDIFFHLSCCHILNPHFSLVLLSISLSISISISISIFFAFLFSSVFFFFFFLSFFTASLSLMVSGWSPGLILFRIPLSLNQVRTLYLIKLRILWHYDLYGLIPIVLEISIWDVVRKEEIQNYLEEYELSSILEILNV